MLLLATHWLVDSLPQSFHWIKLARIYSPRCISSSDSRAMDALNSFGDFDLISGIVRTQTPKMRGGGGSERPKMQNGNTQMGK